MKYSSVTEDPFASAHQENLRLEAKQDEIKLRQKKFESDLKKRLKAYKKMEHQINEDCQLKVQETNQISHHHNPHKKLVKMDIIADSLKNVHPNETKSFNSSASSSRLDFNSYEILTGHKENLA